MKKRLLVVLVAVLPLAGSAAQAQVPFQLWADAAAFRYDEQVSYVEIYYAFPRGSLSYVRGTDAFEAAVIMSVVIAEDGGYRQPVARVWRVPVTLTDTAEASSRMMVGKVTFTLAPARYRMTVTAREETKPESADTLTIPLEIRAFPSRAPLFSDIELCTSIRQVENDPANMFYKNTLEVVPNPPALYGDSQPVLYYYAELYNGNLDPYLIRSEVVSAFGSTLLSRTQRKSGSHASRVEAGSLNVSALPSGTYTMILSYGDTSGTMRISQSKRFYVYNPLVVADTQQIIHAAESIAFEFVEASESELDEAFETATYIATSDERSAWKALKGAEAKRKFLTAFWKQRDADASTPENEFYIEYMRRLRIANEKFRTAYRAGWKTDRGRVFLMYGPPDYVERNQVESDAKPYERWRYDAIQGGVEFIFVDKGGFNNLELVHSTMRNELSDPDWQRYIRTR
ncbi:MAG: GWxTD domain-containing protein [Bacteroidota bacterium]|nr:GWxTD domain-containing protein [Bacteroidota bacterium]